MLLRSGNIPIMKILLQAGADPNIGDRKPIFQVLNQVKITGNIEILSAFLTSSVIHVNVDVINKDGFVSALQYANMLGIIEAATLLSEYKRSYDGLD
jgi:hypothetical protein